MPDHCYRHDCQPWFARSVGLCDNRFDEGNHPHSQTKAWLVPLFLLEMVLLTVEGNGA